MSLYTLAMPVRRTCAICARKEAAASMHLTEVYRDGQSTRACDACRDQHSWYCQNRRCRKEQVGTPYLVGGLSYCGDCAAVGAVMLSPAS